MFNYQADMVLDTVAPNGHRATSMLITVPQMVEQELLRHRAFSFSFASTRAIPIKRQLQMALDNPMRPIFWGKAHKGMQPVEELSAKDVELADKVWQASLNHQIGQVKKLSGMVPMNDHASGFYAMENMDKKEWPEWARTLNVSKAIAGRLLQPYQGRTGLMTGTTWAWKQFFTLRCHYDAQPEIQPLAYMCLKTYMESSPEELEENEWHIPFVTPAERAMHSDIQSAMASAARCARVSYYQLGDEKKLPILLEDVLKANDLLNGSGGIGHWSPFEHQLRALSASDVDTKSGNVEGYDQHRQMYAKQYVKDSVTHDDLLAILYNAPEFVLDYLK